ncbi:hypothetical protein EV102420_22_00500 [Pseudescherichia vulneris NBRC 102420]|uniref:Uncharacterized protein n=1 Tax=Pseudescherichia vulneris NBRC 102420 TaxID=1115515 RepID=A0A090V8W8_PSEVU|nr:hypothetical protein EV102420_22_00500 [Pseudescherichia vulneris NBRC 102420]
MMVPTRVSQRVRFAVDVFMAVFLHKEIKKLSAVNDSEAHFMPGEKRHEMQQGGNEMPWRGNE